MRIREGTPLEIYTDRDGEVIFKKYSLMGELQEYASSIAEAIHKCNDIKVIVCDSDSIIACAGVPKKELMESRISDEIIALIEKRRTYARSAEDEKLFVNESVADCVSVLSPIVSNSDIVGAIMALGSGSIAAESEIKIIETGAMLLSKEMEE